MFGVRDDLIVPLDGVDVGAMLEFWRWLVPVSLTPWFVTALGDLFLRDRQGFVWWLDIGTGALEAVAHGDARFQDCISDPETAGGCSARHWWTSCARRVSSSARPSVTATRC